MNSAENYEQLDNNTTKFSPEITPYDEQEAKRELNNLHTEKRYLKKENEAEIQKLKGKLNIDETIDARIVDLFDQLKHEQNRAEYLKQYITDYLQGIGHFYNPTKIQELLNDYKDIINSNLESNNLEWFNNTILEIKQKIDKSTTERLPLSLCHDTGKLILESTFWKNFKLIGRSWYTGVYKIEWDDKVYKLNTFKLTSSLITWKEYCDSSKSDKVENELFQKMQDYFPQDSVLTPQNHEQNIEINEELIKKLNLPNAQPPKTFTFLYTTTPLASEINNWWVWFNLDFTTWSVIELMWEKFLEKFNWEWVTQEELNEYFDKKFDKVINDIKNLNNDDKKIKELLQWLVKFSDNNDVILDIYWTNNFTFYLDSDWNLQYHIIDQFMPWIQHKPILKKYEWEEKITTNNIHIHSYEYLMQKIKDYCAQ